MIRLAIIALVLFTLPVTAQQTVTTGTGAILRGLDKVNGETVDLEMATGETVAFERLEITLNDCRYPNGNQTGNAFAAMEIKEIGSGDETVFSGWMIASAPALNAMDHARYDVWVLRCTTS